MPELLLELFSEEIPARFQRRAADTLKKMVTDGLVEAGLTYAGAKAFVTPRRLALTVSGLPASSPDRREERKGPRTDAPEKAIEGFLRAAGLESVDQATIQSDPKKGDFYVAVTEKPGEPAPEIIGTLVPKVIKDFPWAKSMRWGSGTMTWVRPLRAVLAVFATDNDETETIGFEVDGIHSGDQTFGHRFMAPDAIRVRRFEDYQPALEKAKVIVDLDRRIDMIRTDAEHLAFAAGLEVISDEGLLEEVAGLVEFPVVMMGAFDPEFLSLPEEVIITTIRANQKCFCLRDAKTGKLANRFILVSNLVASDGGKTIAAGNERVIRARLSDAKFFYDSDIKTPLEDRLPRLESVIFHEKLGTQRARVDRLVALAGTIADRIGASRAEAERAALIAKADLATEMVFEFTELQGLMGRYYATAQGESEPVATAIEMHYKPLGPSDEVPTEPVSIAVALADKLDLLTGFFAIDEKPTGSKDPFALRRAALGVIRMLVENGISLDLSDGLVEAPSDLLSFFHDRLKVMLRDQGARHDLVDAVISEKSADMLVITRRVEALSAFLGSDAGANLLAGYRRAANILAAEEKKDGKAYDGSIDTASLPSDESHALASAVIVCEEAVSAAIAEGDFADALDQLAGLREPVDAFFDKVLVNDPDPHIRAGRLNILARLRNTMHLIADFSKVAG